MQVRMILAVVLAGLVAACATKSEKAPAASEQRTAGSAAENPASTPAAAREAQDTRIMDLSGIDTTEEANWMNPNNPPALKRQYLKNQNSVVLPEDVYPVGTSLSPSSWLFRFKNADAFLYVFLARTPEASALLDINLNSLDLSQTRGYHDMVIESEGQRVEAELYKRWLSRRVHAVRRSKKGLPGGHDVGVRPSCEGPEAVPRVAGRVPQHPEHDKDAALGEDAALTGAREGRQYGMKGSHVARASIEINAKAVKVWKALTDPNLIKHYLFGTEAASDWKVGSAITYKGVWQGKAYEDKGTILEIVPNKLLKSTYWSGMSGLEDKPENYNTVTYELSETRGRTTVTVSQDNNPTRESADHSQGNWAIVLKGMKDLLEKQ